MEINNEKCYNITKERRGTLLENINRKYIDSGKCIMGVKIMIDKNKVKHIIESFKKSKKNKPVKCS